MARLLLLILASALVSVVQSNVGYNLPSPSYGEPDLRAAASEIVEEVDPIAELAVNIPGVPGEDYPILASVPDTGFLCEDQEFPGYYADTADEAGCQVFHICQEDFRQDSFLCPNGTIFNQQHFVCDWWFNVDCVASEDFFRLNADIGKIPEVELLREASDLSNSYAPPSGVVPPAELYNLPQAEEPATTTTTTTTPPPPPAEDYNIPQEANEPSDLSNSYAVHSDVTPPAEIYNIPADEPSTLAPPPPPPATLYDTPTRRRSFFR